jgi:DNA processing protein
MQKNNDLLYKIALGLIPGLGPVNTKNIVAYLGSVKAVFEAGENEFMKIPGIAEKGAKQIIKNRNTLPEARKELEFIQKHNILPLFYTDKDYPFFLKQCNDAPLLIYSKGNIRFKNRKILSFIGTRKASPYGKELCRTIIRQLADKGHNPIIVSGLAYGIDACAHQAALDAGLETVAVLGHGLDRMYPAQHRSLARKIISQGGLLTEFRSDSEFKRQNFLQRNRIIAGISQATVVIESAAKGGSLTTAEYANSYNREVFALPGRIGDKYSEGCNRLIKTHRAVLLQSADDIEYMLSWEGNEKEAVQREAFDVLSDDEKKLLKAMDYGETVSVDRICRSTAMPVYKVSAVLLDLEFKGLIRTLPGKMYELTGQIDFQ